MAFNNGFPIGYQPVNSYQIQPQAQQPQQTTNGIIWVQGEAGAKSYLVAPNNSVTLWDSEAQVIYVKSADASGMPSIKILDYTIRNQEPNRAPPTDFKSFATKDDISLLEKELNTLKSQIKALNEVPNE